MDLGKLLIIVGVGITLMGLVIYLFGHKLDFFGNLPGDFRYQGERVQFYFPFTTMFLVSIVLSLVVWLFRRL